MIKAAGHPPQSKDMIEAAIAMQSLPLSVSSSCKSVGTESTDATIGRYLAGFLAEFSESADKNWIETAIHPGTANGEAIWTCDVNIRHQNGDDRWGWGVRFNVRQSDGTVLQESLRCIGAG